MKRTIFRNILISIVFALLGCMAYLTMDIQMQTVRTASEEEYTDSFLDGQVYAQELWLNHTPNIHVSVLPTYQAPEPDCGVRYTLQTEEATRTGFIPLAELSNHAWTALKISVEDMGYSGTALLTLEAENLSESNKLAFLITTNTVQPHPELALQKDHVEIPNGRLVVAYKVLDFEKLPSCFAFLFVLAFFLMMALPKLPLLFRKYPLVFASALAFGGMLLANWDGIRTINPHVSVQHLFSWQNLGIVRRSFVGTILQLFHIDLDLNTYVLFGLLTIVLMMGVELYFVYNKHNLAYRGKLEKSFWLFLCLPFSFLSFFGYHFFARFDQMLIICFLLSCIAVIKGRGLIAIPLLSMIAILIHEMYLSAFTPFLFILLLYKWYVSQQKKDLICLITTSVVSVGVGGYLSFISKTQTNFEQAWAYIQALDVAGLAWDFPLQVNYYVNSASVIKDGWGTLLSAKEIPAMFLTGIVLLPIIVLTVCWIKAYWSRQKDLFGRLIVLLFPCTVGALGINMIAMCDWGRLFVMYGVGVYFSFVTLWSIDPKNVQAATDAVWGSVLQKYGKHTLPALCVVYLLLTVLAGGATSGSLYSFFNVLLR
ncbi:hypothetical protein [Oscillibacter ruminantium]|uniref:hypothetical protein n=1 Tax=Oscillibacter ruminantium TaxID=1263547 RepID=UPI0002E6D00C|nr:hypothetical protein [Oscillibacter ruminantium]